MSDLISNGTHTLSSSIPKLSIIAPSVAELLATAMSATNVTLSLDFNVIEFIVRNEKFSRLSLTYNAK